MLNKLYLALTILLFTVSAHAEKNVWFSKSSKLLLSKELNTCQNHKKVGNLKLAGDCITSKLNAYDWLKQKADDPALSPFIGESVCVDKIRLGFEYGARCMAVAADLCIQDPSGNIANPLACLRTFSGSNWQNHPAAQKLDFTRPNRSEEEVVRYMH